MFTNLLKTTLRKLRGQVLFSVLNIFGLATGMACTILIFLWAKDELSYDRHNLDAGLIYRVNWDYNWKGNEGIGPGTPPPLAEAISREIPEVQSAIRIYNAASMVVRRGDKFFNEDKIFGVDQNIFDFFTLRMLSGNAGTALSRPNSVVLTEALASKYFGEEPALGKTITMGETEEMFRGKYYNEFEVTGVVENPPHNSHFQFDFLTSMDSHPAVAYFDWSWVWMQVATYAKLEPGASPRVVESKIPELVEKYAPAAFRRIGFSYEELISSGGHWDFVLQSMDDIYLGSGEIGNRLGPIGSRVYVYLFSVIAVFVLFLACINFMNLATARSSQRAQETGIRKTLGSTKQMLIGQFLMESMVYALAALPLALLIAGLAMVPFNQLTAKALTLNLLSPWWFMPALAGLTVAVGIIAGSYPGFYLSSFNPVQVLKGANAGQRSRHLRNALVLFQFVITIGLIVCTLVVQKQMTFITQANLGFDKENVVVISNKNHRLGEQAETFKQSIKNQAGIVDASISTGVPPYTWFDDYYKIEGEGDQQYSLGSYLTDEDFFATLNLQIVAGRPFSKDFSGDAESVVLNEAAVQYFGWEKPLGKRIYYSNGASYKVVGVVKDFNLLTLHYPIQPFGLFHTSSNSYQVSDSYVIVRISGMDIEQSIRELESQWQKFAPDKPFEYEFLDESFAAQYTSERRLGLVFIVFSGLTIIIACFGLLGLAAFSAEKRTKEIGVRKVLGASVTRLVLLLSKEFTRWVVLANLVAWPAAYFAMNLWLQDFAYRIDISWDVFLASGVLALTIAIATVSVYAIRAALANPVVSLRYE